MPSHADPDTRAFYLAGACHAFALALAERTGWSLAALVDDARGYDDTGCFPLVAHVLAADDRDGFWDVTGRHTLSELKAAYPDLQAPRIYWFAGARELAEDWSGESDARPLHALDGREMTAAREAVAQAFPNRFRTG